MKFSRGFFEILIVAALVMTGAGAGTLIVLWVRDLIKGKVW